MTTFRYSLFLNDGEMIMLKAALQLMIATCEENIANGEEAPNWAHKTSAEDVLERLYENAQQTSGSSF